MVVPRWSGFFIDSHLIEHMEHRMSSRAIYDYDQAENLAAVSLTPTRLLRVQFLPPTNARYAAGLNVRKFRIIDEARDVHTGEGLTIELTQLDDIIGALELARDRLRASGRLERPGDDSLPATAARKARSDPEKRADVLRLAADGLTVREIESETGVSRSTVARWIAEEAEMSSATAE